MSETPNISNTFARPENRTSTIEPSLVRSYPPFRGGERQRPAQNERPDAAMCRKIYDRYGLSLARTWVTKPMVDLTAKAFGPENTIATKDVFFALEHIPFNDAVYCCTIRTPAAHALAARRMLVSLNIERTGAGVFEILCAFDGADALVSAIIDLNNPGTPGVAPILQIETPPQLSYAIGILAVKVIQAVLQASEYLVEVTQESQSKQDIKTMEKKPWAAPVARRVILLDPAKATEYGHRIDRGGAHASPSPHQRRGHWATLKSERYKNKRGQRVWVRPAWVGDKEWIFEGNRYRVLSAEAPS